VEHVLTVLLFIPIIRKEGLIATNFSCYVSDQILTELIQVGGETIRSGTHKLVYSIWNKENCLSSARGLLMYQFTRRVIELTVVIIEAYHCYQLYTKFYPTSLTLVCRYVDKIIGDHQCGFRRNRSTTDKIFCIIR
jgi:hypothetical protein